MDLPIHFFTIVQNGEPFIRWHAGVFSKLPGRWHWHVVEGVADLKHDTAWSVPLGAEIPQSLRDKFRSTDGTSEYLDYVKTALPDKVTLYRKQSAWDGKIEMVNAPLANIREECLLWEIDSDEIWTPDQIERIRRAMSDPRIGVGVFGCHYFVGPSLVVADCNIAWKRVWRYRPGMKWATHEPPVMSGEGPAVELAERFQHFGYATEAQAVFKETYYGYHGLVERWRALQVAPMPARLKQYMPEAWVSEAWTVDQAQKHGITPLCSWEPNYWKRLDDPLDWPGVTVMKGRDPLAQSEPTADRGVLYVFWGKDIHLLKRSIRSLRAVHPEMPIMVRLLPEDASFLDKAQMRHWTPFATTLFLDIDTTVMGRLDAGFAAAERHGLACCICECPWARRYQGIGKSSELIEYNTGVLFFTRKVHDLFDHWQRLTREVDSSIRHIQNGQVAIMPVNDQAAFALALERWESHPFILPLNWNFRPRWHRGWFGPIRIWHDYQEPDRVFWEWTHAQQREDAIIDFAAVNDGR